MTPNAYITYVVVHPDWRGAGIGTFMIYHLIQTCHGKDITLHVSSTNPAMILYQKFGFKPEEYVIDFYDKYYPDPPPSNPQADANPLEVVSSSETCSPNKVSFNMSKNAFFLRLRR
eukprot:Sdes_comp20472_c0_seq2m14745